MLFNKRKNQYYQEPTTTKTARGASLVNNKFTNSIFKMLGKTK